MAVRRPRLEVAERIRLTGGDLRYLAMDEPLWFGHQFTGPSACRTPVDELAREVATNVAIYRSVFPAVQVGDIEPFGSANSAGWTDQIMGWSQAYEHAVGRPLAFFHVDVNWNGPWRSQLALLVPRLHAVGLKFGIIYNGDRADQTSLAWTQHAEQRFAAIEAESTLTPEQAILQTWMPHPSRMLPETRPGTMTWLVNRYLAAETRLALHRTGEHLEGQLTDSAGRPLPGATVAVAARWTGETGATAMHKRSGSVPRNAVDGLFALRINTECNCSGPAEIRLGPVSYRDDRTGQRFQQSLGPQGSGALVEYKAQPGQAIAQNTSHFPVAPGDPFTVEEPMRTDLTSANSGYVALIFLDGKGKEVGRSRITFQPAEQSIGAVITDSVGSFSLLPNPVTLRNSVGFRAEFPGDEKYRSASATLP